MVFYFILLDFINFLNCIILFVLYFFFIVLYDVSCLLCFIYYCFLVDWYVEGFLKDILFIGYCLESCFIIIGGIIIDEDNRMLFGEIVLSERLDIKDL